jgi:hypothetical protein
MSKGDDEHHDAVHFDRRNDAIIADAVLPQPLKLFR